MTPCLLCPSPAVADGLCVQHGARKWAADGRLRKPAMADLIVDLADAGMTPKPGAEPRIAAVRELSTPDAARAFLDRLDAAREVSSRKGSS